MFKLPGLLALLLLSSVTSAYATPAQVILIRHAEEPEEGIELNKRGWQRAHALVGFFLKNPAVTRYGTPVAIYAMGQKKQDSSIRPIQTVTPLSERLSLPLHTDYTREEYADAAEEILENPEYDGKMVLICWARKAIPEFAVELGLKNGPDEWSGDIYDRAWILDYSRGKVVRFHDIPQRLLSGDSQK